VAAVLLSHKAFVGAKTKLGKTPLHLAAENGYVILVEVLVMKFKAAVDALTLVSALSYSSIHALYIRKGATRCTQTTRIARYIARNIGRDIYRAVVNAPDSQSGVSRFDSRQYYMHSRGSRSLLSFRSW